MPKDLLESSKQWGRLLKMEQQAVYSGNDGTFLVNNNKNVQLVLESDLAAFCKCLSIRSVDISQVQ